MARVLQPRANMPNISPEAHLMKNTPSNTSRFAVTWPIALLSAAMLAGCGSGGTEADKSAPPAATPTPEEIVSVRNAGTVFEIMGPKEEAVLRGWVALDRTGELRAVVETDGGAALAEGSSVSFVPPAAPALLPATLQTDKGYWSAKPASPLTPPVTVEIHVTTPDVTEGTATVTLESSLRTQ